MFVHNKIDSVHLKMINMSFLICHTIVSSVKAIIKYLYC